MMSSNFKKFERDFLWLTLPLLLSLYYFWNLGENSFWYDELQTWSSVSQNSFSDFWREYRIRESAPPLYYFLNYLLHRLIAIDEISLRFISALSLTVCNLALFFYLRRFFNLWVGLGFVILMVTNSWMLGFAHQARNYGLFTLLSMLSLIFCLHLIQKGYQKNIFLALVVSLTLCLFTHYFGSLVVGAVASLLFFYSPERKFYLKKIYLFMLLPALGFIFILGNQHWARHLTFIKALDWTGVHEVLGLVFSSNFENALLNFSLLFLIFRLATRSFHPWDRVLGLLAAFNLIVLLETFIISLIKPAYTIRYLTFLAPTHILFLVIAAYAAFEDVFSFAKNSALKKTAIAFSFVAFVFLFAGSQKIQQLEEPERFLPTITYPLRQALEAIIASHRLSPFANDDIELFIEENSPDAVRLYFPNYNFGNIGIANPRDSVAQKTKDFKQSLTIASGPSVYYLKVVTRDVNEDFNVIHLENWKAEKVFIQDRLSVYRFSKAN